MLVIVSNVKNKYPRTKRTSESSQWYMKGHTPSYFEDRNGMPILVTYLDWGKMGTKIDVYYEV